VALVGESFGSPSGHPAIAGQPEGKQMDIGQVVRTIRKARGLTLREVAQRMGNSQPHLYNLEQGRRNWQSNTILSAARALGVRPFVLLMSDRERRRAMLVFG
jgi:transcriptional regulator with XRE-family HTH domain